MTGAEEVDEYAIEYAGGGMLVRRQNPAIERVYPLAAWIEDHQRNGGRVHHRRVIVTQPWALIPRHHPA